jgi:hypothetical protein
MQHHVYQTKPEPKPKPDVDGKQPEGTTVKGERPPVPNWRCYLNLAFFAGKNIDKHGNWIGRGKLPTCNVCHDILPPKEHHTCHGYVPKYPLLPDNSIPFEDRMAMRRAAWDDHDDDQYDRTTPGDITPQYDDWDDDQYDPTTDAEIDLEYRSEYEDSGTVAYCEDMTEDEWIERKRRHMGLARDCGDEPEFDSEEDHDEPDFEPEAQE